MLYSCTHVATVGVKGLIRSVFHTMTIPLHVYFFMSHFLVPINPPILLCLSLIWSLCWTLIILPRFIRHYYTAVDVCMVLHLLLFQHVHHWSLILYSVVRYCTNVSENTLQSKSHKRSKAVTRQCR